MRHTRRQQHDAALLNAVISRGFDASRIDPDGGVVLGCSQCEPLAICSVPTHETGCPNAHRHECVECGQTYARRADAVNCCAAWNTADLEDL